HPAMAQIDIQRTLRNLELLRDLLHAELPLTVQGFRGQGGRLSLPGESPRAPAEATTGFPKFWSKKQRSGVNLCRYGYYFCPAGSVTRRCMRSRVIRLICKAVSCGSPEAKARRIGMSSFPPASEEDVAHLSPARFAHINPYGKYFFPIEQARNRQGLRSLRAA